MVWGKKLENCICFTKTFKIRVLGPAKNDRLFYIHFGFIKIRIMNPFRE